MNEFYKLTILTFLLSIQSFYFSKAQTIHQGDVNLETQAQVDSFGAEGYTHINGYLRIGNIEVMNIGNPSDINNLNALIGLKTVDSSLVINENPLLTNLVGLDSLSVAGKSVQIRVNQGLQSLQGLGSLEQTDLLIINYCNALNNLNGLSSYQGSSTASISIVVNHNLSSLDGLEQLTSVKGLYISKNDYLTDISALENLTYIDNYLSFYENETLTTLNGLQNVESVNRINIVDNYELRDFCAISTIYNNGYLNQFDVAEYNVENNAYNPSFVDIENNACSIPPVSITESPTPASVILSPNPTTGVLHLNFSTPERHTIHITNLTGQTVYKTVTTSTSNFTYDLNAPKGIYIVEVTSGINKQQFKVVKQ